MIQIYPYEHVLNVFNLSYIMAGKHLAEHCRAEYPKVPNFILWLLAELAVVACDIPEGVTLNRITLLLFYFVLYLLFWMLK